MLAYGSGSFASRMLCSSYIYRRPRELFTGPILCQYYNDSTSPEEPPLAVCHDDALERPCLADRAWKIPSGACPSQLRTSMHPSKYILQLEQNKVLTKIFQIPAGDPEALALARAPDVQRWKAWFGAWTHLQTIAFICEDIWWRRSSQTTTSQAAEKAEGIVHEWFGNSSLKNFEIWSGADSIQLSRQFQVAYARFHNIHHTQSTRHQYSFRRNEHSRTWILSPPTLPMHSAALQFRGHVCTDGCWICIAIEEEDDLETLISCLDDVREEDWRGRMQESKPWSMWECDPTYIC